MIQRNMRDTVLLSGWLFADLLLGLTIIFMASIPGVQPRLAVIPTLVVTPTSLSPTSSVCTGGITNPMCTLIVSETSGSLGPMTWTASNDMSDNLVFSPSSGTLTPGQSVKVTVSLLCQNGSLTFSGSRGAKPVIVSWHCVPAADRLDFHYHSFNLRVDDINGLLNSSDSAVSSIETQVRNQTVLQGRRVGLAIVYGGAPTDADIGTALALSQKVYAIFKHMASTFAPLHNASYYDPLFRLNGSSTIVIVQVYLFVQ